MVSIRHKGDFSRTFSYLGKLKKGIRLADLEKYGRKGVEALASATPVDTGLTANSFHNSNIQNGVPIAIILHYGHGTRNGGWVQGRDYINPAIQPIFDELANNAWREVTKL